MEFKRFFNSVIRMSWIIVLSAIIGGGASAYMNPGEVVYSAETTIYALSRGNDTNGQPGINYQDLLLSRQLVQDYQEIIASDKVCTLALGKLHDYDITADSLKNMVYVNPKNESSIIGVVAVASDPKLAAEVSNVVTEAFLTRLQELTNNSIVGVIDAAKVPGIPLDNDSRKKTVIGVVGGMALALAFIYIKELFNSTLRSIDEAEKIANIKVVGVIPKYKLN